MAIDLDAIRARVEAAAEGPWEVGDRYHVQGASHCTCAERYGPLVWEGRCNINGWMMQAHIHRRQGPIPSDDTSIYGGPSPDQQYVIALSTDEYVSIDPADAEFIAHAREDVPALLAEVEQLREYIDRMPYPSDMDQLRAERDRAEATIARVRELHQPVEIEPSGTICGHCSYRLPNGHYFGKVEEWPCPTIAAIEGTDS